MIQGEAWLTQDLYLVEWRGTHGMKASPVSMVLKFHCLYTGV